MFVYGCRHLYQGIICFSRWKLISSSFLSFPLTSLSHLTSPLLSPFLFFFCSLLFSFFLFSSLLLSFFLLSFFDTHPPSLEFKQLQQLLSTNSKEPSEDLQGDDFFGDLDTGLNQSCDQDVPVTVLGGGAAITLGLTEIQLQQQDVVSIKEGASL